MRSLAEYRESREKLPKWVWDEMRWETGVTTKFVHAYDRVGCIEEDEDGEFSVCIDRTYISGTLAECEEWLWNEFAKEEYFYSARIHLSDDETDKYIDDLINDMHAQCQWWLDDHGFDCSLDEVPTHFLHEKERLHVERLLRWFEAVREIQNEFYFGEEFMESENKGELREYKNEQK